jgi:hypothetical protein
MRQMRIDIALDENKKCALRKKCALKNCDDKKVKQLLRYPLFQFVRL